MARFVSTKEFKELTPVAYRQWRDKDGNCGKVHGYALSFRFSFESDSLDFRNWVVDYGGLRPLKECLETWFDHKLLVAADDPQLDEFMALERAGLAEVTVVEATGCEAIADYLYCWINSGFLQELGYPEDVWCCEVQVRETEKNMAYRQGHRSDNEDLINVSVSNHRRSE